MKLAVIIITYDRVKDAKINMELIRHLWSDEKELADIEIVHVFNGNKEWYPDKYLEDKLIRTPNLGHFEGAGMMIDAGINYLLSKSQKFDFIITCSADTWLVKPAKLAEILRTMKAQDRLISASLWFTHYVLPNSLSTEFFIISPKLAAKIFPLKVEEFAKNHRILEILHRMIEPLPMVAIPKVELVLTDKIWREFAENKSLLKLKDKVLLTPHRRVVWVGNRYFSSAFGYLSHHNFAKKLRLLRKLLPQVMGDKSAYPYLNTCLEALGEFSSTDSGRPWDKALRKGLSYFPLFQDGKAQ